MGYLFTSESVSEGHPDKVADQISDALLDEFLRHDPNSKVACETLVTTGLAVCAGEVRTRGWVNVDDVARQTIREIGYTKSAYKFDGDSCGVISTIHEQSGDINMGVSREKEEDQGAGDQGMMFGYACREMDNYMPMPIELAHIFLQELAAIRKEGKEMTYLRPDSKSQITIEYDDNHQAQRIDTIVISTQHDDFDDDDKRMLRRIEEDVRNILIPRVKNSKDVPEKVKKLFKGDFRLYVNPTGKFVIGGPHGDTGLTGRKIIVDTYGGKGAHGGGAFSGKDASKVDRSAAYATRHIAKNLVAAGVADEAMIQVAYAIGRKDHVGLFVNTFGTAKVKNADGSILPDGEIAKMLDNIFDLTPHGIIKRFGLRNPIFKKTASYGHFGREPFDEEVEVYYDPSRPGNYVNGNLQKYKVKVSFFAWEKEDYIDKIREAFRM
ncbi:MAG: methionine adenosyltransferase [Bacteroidales bacterium]|nr:methionine adenosyltransferase [Bacteroidales bacterium]